MSALRQPVPAKYYSPRIQPQEIAPSPREIVEQPQGRSAKVVRQKSFYSSKTLPKNLKILSLLQKVSFGLAVASMTTSIGVYISTVKIPKLWSQEYQHLENLQLQERQLIAINETLKYQIAREAGHDSRLSVTKPESAVFISPAKIEAKKQNTSKSDREILELKHNSYGY